ncbi:MAG: hypothetical protein AB1333_04555 [Patescibacteria group bacterium]
MNEQVSPNGNDFNPTATKKPRSFRPVFVGLGVVVVVIVLWFIYLVFFSPDARRDFQMQKNYNQAIRAINTYEEAMRNDAYGGKTPQETLNLFIDALKKEDIELASKYFILRSDGSPDSQWLEGLKKAKEEDKILEVVEKLKHAEPYKKDITHEMDYKLVVFDQKKEIDIYIDLGFNKYSGVWKIENL